MSTLIPMSEKRQRDEALGVIAQIMENGTATRKSLNPTPPTVDMLRMEQADLVKRAGVERTGSRGRPAVIWRATDKARKRVKRAVASGRVTTA